MQLWANNGDIISKQYAGTNALKVVQTICSNYLNHTEKKIILKNVKHFG